MARTVVIALVGGPAQHARVRRVVIVGCSGSGKSQLARMLGARVGMPVIHADREFWQPGWTDPDNDEYRSKIDRLTAGSAWVFDGIPGRVPDIVLPRADTVLWIEQPMWLCAARSYLRMLTHIGQVRPDMAEGCPERLTLQLWKYAKTFDATMRPRIEGWIEDYAAYASVVRLKGDRAVAHFAIANPASSSAD